MPAFIANRLYPPLQVLVFPIPPVVLKGMLFLESLSDPMVFLDADPMLFLGA